MMTSNNTANNTANNAANNNNDTASTTYGRVHRIERQLRGQPQDPYLWSSFGNDELVILDEIEFEPATSSMSFRALSPMTHHVGVEQKDIFPKGVCDLSEDAIEPKVSAGEETDKDTTLVPEMSTNPAISKPIVMPISNLLQQLRILSTCGNEESGGSQTTRVSKVCAIAESIGRSRNVRWSETVVRSSV